MSHPTKPTDVGTNRTGLAMSPFDGSELLKAAEERAGRIPADGDAITAARLTLAREARPVGTMPPPGNLKGAVRTLVSRLKGESPTVFLDKLGERLAYERGGVRLYEALLVKLQASDNHDPTLTLEALRRIQEEELAHAGIVAEAIETLGGDPTALTPCADVVGVMTMGFVQVLSDPRTTLTQCLNAMLAVELADGAGWQLLIDVAEGLGERTLAEQFRRCDFAEVRHQEMIEAWVSTAVVGQAVKKLDVGRPPWA